MNDVDWKSLVGTRCLVILHPFWSSLEGKVSEVVILETTPDGEYVTYRKLDDGEIVKWRLKNRIALKDKLKFCNNIIGDTYLLTHTSYKGNPCWENTITDAVLLEMSPNGKYVKLEFTRTDETKNIVWEETEEIIFKYKLENREWKKVE